MTLEAAAARKAAGTEEANLHARYGHLLGWDADKARAEERRAGRAVRKNYRAGAQAPAWRTRRRTKLGDRGGSALLSATFYRLVAEHLEATASMGGIKADRKVGHAFTLKELAALEQRARQLAPDSIDHYIRRPQPDEA